MKTNSVQKTLITSPFQYPKMSAHLKKHRSRQNLIWMAKSIQEINYRTQRWNQALVTLKNRNYIWNKLIITNFTKLIQIELSFTRKVFSNRETISFVSFRTMPKITSSVFSALETLKILRKTIKAVFWSCPFVNKQFSWLRKTAIIWMGLLQDFDLMKKMEPFKLLVLIPKHCSSKEIQRFIYTQPFLY